LPFRDESLDVVIMFEAIYYFLRADRVLGECRRVLRYNGFVVERAESSLYFLEQELSQDGRAVKIIPVVGDIMDRWKVEEVFQQYIPEIVYHAAAYKHVPLMEAHPLVAIENNVFGTEIVAQAARGAGVRRFVLVSTDKAVRSVGIMGMTKRVAECLVLALEGARCSSSTWARRSASRIWPRT